MDIGRLRRMSEGGFATSNAYAIATLNELSPILHKSATHYDTGVW